MNKSPILESPIYNLSIFVNLIISLYLEKEFIPDNKHPFHSFDLDQQLFVVRSHKIQTKPNLHSRSVLRNIRRVIPTFQNTKHGQRKC